MTIAVTHTTGADASFSVAGKAAWEEGHVVTGATPLTVSNDIYDYTGFVNPANITRTYDEATRTVTLTAITGTLDYYWRSVIKTLGATWTSSAHPVTLDASYFLSSTDGTNFTWSTGPWAFSDVMAAYVHYRTNDKFCIGEVHGTMPVTDHEELHDTVGTYRKAGGALSGYVLGSTTAANRRVLVAQTTVKDEDLPTVLDALTTNSYTQFSLTGAATPVFTKAATDKIALSANRPYYNQLTGGNYTQTLMTANAYTCVWLVAVPTTSDVGSKAYRYLWVQGQSEGTLSAQQALQSSSVSIGTFGTLDAEYVFIGKVILQYVAANWVLTSVEALIGTKRGQNSVTGIASLPASAITVDTTGFNDTVPTNAQLQATKVDRWFSKIQSLGTKDTNYTVDFNIGRFATVTTGTAVATLTIPDWSSAAECPPECWLYVTQGGTVRQQTIGAASGTNNNVIGSGAYAKALPYSGINLVDAYCFTWTGSKWMITNMIFDVKAIV